MTATLAPKLIRQDGRDKVTGSGRYAADLTMTGMLHGALRVADVSHARIRRIDTTAARALPGVHAIITAADAPPEILGDDRDEGADPAAPAGTLRALRAQAERQIVVSALDKNDWHVTRTAEALGLADHSSLLKIMRRHGLSKSTHRDA